MPDHALQIIVGIYALWIGGIVLAMYLMLTGRAAAYPVISIVLWGSNGAALLIVFYAIAHVAGAL